MRVGEYERFFYFRARKLAPIERYPVKETLNGGEPFDNRMSGFREMAMVGVERDGIAAKISDVFSHGELAAHMDAVERVGVELLAEDARSAFEAAAIGLGPPALYVAVSIELRALVVEAVRDLVANDAAD